LKAFGSASNTMRFVLKFFTHVPALKCVKTVQKAAMSMLETTL